MNHLQINQKKNSSNCDSSHPVYLENFQDLLKLSGELRQYGGNRNT